ncbi:MAG: hypothetical protein ACKO6F_11970, partial [Cyanobium sp.]
RPISPRKALRELAIPNRITGLKLGEKAEPSASSGKASGFHFWFRFLFCLFIFRRNSPDLRWD